jgi:hypothetical protein
VRPARAERGSRRCAYRSRSLLLSTCWRLEWVASRSFSSPSTALRPNRDALLRCANRLRPGARRPPQTAESWRRRPAGCSRDEARNNVHGPQLSLATFPSAATDRPSRTSGAGRGSRCARPPHHERAAHGGLGRFRWSPVAVRRHRGCRSRHRRPLGRYASCDPAKSGQPLRIGAPIPRRAVGADPAEWEEVEVAAGALLVDVAASADGEVFVVE